ncbi:recombinase family protein [Umezawaea tangerina]|uniref:Resolvase-like protein n=1 Tax=Umezawaea tangerina TaxID=84725 RepID=A0A2T0T4F2_9PSEU|nr:recombinase family protein [Umezawaea tangerina]PRY40513.1 resolvase-like protein [Umezawaea tangerina]
MPAPDEAPQAETSRPVVYGYLRLEEPDNDQIAMLCKELSSYCAEAGFLLASVFVDREVPGKQVKRPGFAGVIDVLDLASSHGVVVPHLDHLSIDNEVLAFLRRLIRRRGSVLLVVHEEEDLVKADGP